MVHASKSHRQSSVTLAMHTALYADDSDNGPVNLCDSMVEMWYPEIISVRSVSEDNNITLDDHPRSILLDCAESRWR